MSEPVYYKVGRKPWELKQHPDGHPPALAQVARCPQSEKSTTRTNSGGQETIVVDTGAWLVAHRYAISK